MFNNTILFVYEGNELVTQHTVVNEGVTRRLTRPGYGVLLSDVKARVGESSFRNSVVVFVRGEVFFVFMCGSVLYGSVGDLDHLLDHLLKIRYELNTLPDIRNRTILHISEEGFGRYNIIPTIDPVAHRALIDYQNNKLF